MKKKLILCSSLAVLSLATVLSLTSCGGRTTSDVKAVKSEILDTALVTSEKTSDYYTKFETYTSSTQFSGCFIVDYENNKIYNYLTGKSITVENLVEYSIGTYNIYVNGYGNVYLLSLADTFTSTNKTTILYDNNLEKIVEVTTDWYDYLNVDGSYVISTKDNDISFYTVCNYIDLDEEIRTEELYFNVNKKTGFVTKSSGPSNKKDSKSYGYSTFTDNLYYKSTPNKEYTNYSFYDSSYNEICQLETNVNWNFKLEFNDKVYIQGYREVAEDYKDVITVYSKGKYYYYDMKTYCIDLTNKKVKEIDTDVYFRGDCKGNKDSEYFVANYSKFENNFVDLSYYFTGFFKDAELEYSLPITITDVETGIKKIGEDYLIKSNTYINLYNKDMEPIKSINSLNKYNIYSDSKNFKYNFYKANGDLLYSTENQIDTDDLDSTGYAYEYKDGAMFKVLVFADSEIKVVSIGEKDSIDEGLIITDNEDGSYTIKQIGGTASFTVYGNNVPNISSSTTYGCKYYSISGTFYLDSAKTQRARLFVGRK